MPSTVSATCRYAKISAGNNHNSTRGGVDAAECRTKVSLERGRHGAMLYSPVDMNTKFKEEFEQRDWHQERIDYAVTADQVTLADTAFFGLSFAEQKERLDRDEIAWYSSYNQTDFVNQEVAVEVQFGKYAFVAFDLFVKHLSFFQQGKIHVGVEILPMRALRLQMSSGPAYYEREIFNLARQGRTSPPVPLIILGIAPDEAPASLPDAEVALPPE